MFISVNDVFKILKAQFHEAVKARNILKKQDDLLSRHLQGASYWECVLYGTMVGYQFQVSNIIFFYRSIVSLGSLSHRELNHDRIDSLISNSRRSHSCQFGHGPV